MTTEEAASLFPSKDYDEIVIVGSTTASIMVVLHDKPLVHLVWVGVAGVSRVLIHAALRCAGVPVSRKAKKATWVPPVSSFPTPRAFVRHRSVRIVARRAADERPRARSGGSPRVRSRRTHGDWLPRQERRRSSPSDSLY